MADLTPPLDSNLLLLHESAVVIINGCNLTSDILDEVWNNLGQEDACHFFTAPTKLNRGVNTRGLGWPLTKFNLLDWSALKSALATKPDIHSVWLAKQTIVVILFARTWQESMSEMTNNAQMVSVVWINMITA